MIGHAALHHLILTYLIDHGYAPETEEIARLLGATEEEVVDALHALQDYHGVVLHPHAPKIWVIHPFATAPTNFLVECGGRKWWGNCAWCSLGIAALLDTDTVITTTYGAHGERVQIHIENGEVVEKDLLVHFPIPMREAWNNVIYTCSTMLIFRREAEISDWCVQHRIAQGDIQPLPNAWKFARAWYGRHMDTDWKKWTLAEASEIFAQHGLTHAVWQLQSTSGRF